MDGGAGGRGTAASLVHGRSAYPHSDCKDNKGIYTALQLENVYNVSKHLTVEEVRTRNQPGHSRGSFPNPLVFAASKGGEIHIKSTILE